MIYDGFFIVGEVDVEIIYEVLIGVWLWLCGWFDEDCVGFVL